MTYPATNKTLWLMLSFLLLNINYLQSKYQLQHVQLNYEENSPILSEQNKEKAWYGYIKLNEGSWIHFNFANTSKNNWSITFSQKKALCKELYGYLSSQGVNTSHITIKYAPTASLVVYKESGKNIQANHFKLNKENAQVFEMTNGNGAACLTKKGNKIEFPPRAFKCAANSKIKVVVHEALSNSDFVRSGYTATANGKLLESKGMYYIEAFTQGKKVSLRRGQNVFIKFNQTNFPRVNEAPLFHTFYGQKKQQIIDWSISGYEKIMLTKTVSDLPQLHAGQRTHSIQRKDSIFTELFYVRLCSKIHLINPKIAAKAKNCKLTRRDYYKLINLYGNLNTLVGDQPEEISSYQAYLAETKTKPSLLLISLNAQQQKSYDAALLKEQTKESNEAAMEETEEFIDQQTSAEIQLAYKKRIADEIKNFPVEMKISQLGQINCDRFNDGGKKADVIVQLNEYDYDQIRVYVVFNEIKSVINGYYREEHKDFIRFDKLPIGKQVTYLAAAFKGNQVQLAYLSKKIEADDHIKLSMTNYTRDQYERILDDLIP